MAAPRPRFRFSLQTKVLVVVLGFLVLVPTVTLWIVNDRMQEQMDGEALRTLKAAESVFVKSLDNRSHNILARYGSVADEARFQVVARLGDPKTIRGLLQSLLNDSPAEHEIILFSPEGGAPPVGVRRTLKTDLNKAEPEKADLDQFARGAGPVTRAALEGSADAGSIGFDGRAYTVVAVPVLAQDRGPVVGALTVGIRLDEATVKELKLPRTEILLVADGQVVVTTVPTDELPSGLLAGLAAPGAGAQPAERLVVAGEHFMARAGDINGGGARPGGMRYVLLSSYESSLNALESTRRVLVILSVAGILVSALFVSWFVRRVTQPLRELRDMAEAVGRGEFTKKIERFSNDECGELAEEFNHMTANLQTSRAELERAMQTVKTTQAQLIQSEKLSAVGQFVAGVAHELNNPLTAVVGFSELLQHIDADEKTRHHLDLITKSAHRCHKIVHSLLSFARQHAPERKLVEVNQLVDGVLEIMAYDLRTSNVTVVREFESGLPPIMADPHQVQQVFVNILGNARQAIQAFRRDGEIVVRTRCTDGMVRIEFQDNGPGIRTEHLSRIFDPFFTTKPVGKGTGLGLSLSYGIIQEHGGRITARSEVGHGAAFLIELPAATPQAAAVVRPDSANPFERPGRPRAAGAGKAVLVIDDETWILELTEELLRHEGYDVEAVSSGEAALARIKERKFDVIVSDWKMPGLSGIYLYEQLLATDPAAAARILFMTGDVINDTFEQFLERNGRTCLSKPFSIDDFRAAVAGMTVGRN